MRWEETHCEFCGSDRKNLYIESDIPAWYEKRPIRLEQCLDCDFVYASPRPLAEDLYKRFMTDSPFAKTITERKRARKNVQDIHDRIVLEAIEAHGNEPKSLFDMGCGAGTIIEAAAARGLRAGGNDLNWYSTKILRESGYDVRTCFTSELDIKDSYDIVTMLDVLEHSYTPSSDLKVAYGFMSPGAILYAKTLYLGCPKHLAEGEHWSLYGAGHFSYFTPDVLQKMVEAAGFTILKIRSVALIHVIAQKPVDSNGR